MAFGLADLLLISRLKEQGYILPTAAVIEIGAQQVNETLRTSDADLEALGRLCRWLVSSNAAREREINGVTPMSYPAARHSLAMARRRVCCDRH